jgi:hypothetical protein
VLGLAALLIYHEWRQPVGLQTVWMGLPFAILVTLFGLIWGGKKLGQQPVLAYFFGVCLVALHDFVGWGLSWGGFPKFSDGGLSNGIGVFWQLNHWFWQLIYRILDA